MTLWLLLLAAGLCAQVQDFSHTAARTVTLRAGDTVEVSVGLPSPSQLPPNGRVAVEWAGYRKVLHALDPDFYMVYRAPKAGTYALKANVIDDEEPIFNLPRWREA